MSKPKTAKRVARRKPRQPTEPKPSPERSALAEMVRSAEAAGQRDLPHVVSAREVLSH